MPAKYKVSLTDDERQVLTALVSKGKAAARKLLLARILLKADASPAGPNWLDEQITAAFDVGRTTVYRVRQAFVEEGLEASLYRKPATNRQYRKLDGVQEAHLVALACSAPPAGHVCWTMQLLADKLVELEIVESIGREAVRTTLKKTFFSPGAKSNGCCRPSKTPILSARWKTRSKSTIGPTIRSGPPCVLTSKAGN